MKSIKLTIVTVILILLTRNTNLAQAQGESLMSEQSVSLSQLLKEIGDSYDVFFTFEGAWKDGEIMTPLEAYQVQRVLVKRNLQDTLEALRQNVPNFTFEVNRRNSRIIHIVDARLARQNCIERTLKRLDFEGTVSDLVTALNQQGVPISEPRLMDTHEALFWDQTTKIEIQEQGLKIREILSNFISLEGRRRTLWIARTRLAPGEITYVHFISPKKARNQ